MRATIAIAVLLLAATAARASQQTFDEATALMRDGNHAAAAAAFVALVDNEPGSPAAASALFEAGNLYEERLGDPARALALYERLLLSYPDSRAALGASRRINRLRADLGPDGAGAEALGRFNEVKRLYPERTPAESIRLVETILDDHPGWAGAPGAVLWLARANQREGDLDRAAARYREVTERWPEAPDAFDAYRGAGDVALIQGRLDDAERLFGAMQTGDDPTKARAVEAAFVRLAKERRRAGWYTLSFIVLGIVALLFLGSLRQAAGSWPRAGRALRRPPTEVIYFTPVAAAILLFAFTGHEDIAPATAIILAGGFLISWLSGAALSVDRLRWRLLAHAAASAVGALSVVYIAVHRTRLVDLVIQTVRMGPSH